MTDTTHIDTGHTDTGHRAHDDHAEHGLSDFGYIKVAIFSAVITAIEVGLSYTVDDLGALSLPVMLGLMLLKFFMVILYFMHLKFDSKLFSLMFYLGLGLVVGVYGDALMTFRFFDA